MDIDLTQLKQLIAIAENANIGQLEISDGDQRISIFCQSPIFTLLPAFSTASSLVAPQHHQAQAHTPSSLDATAPTVSASHMSALDVSSSDNLNPNTSNPNTSNPNASNPSTSSPAVSSADVANIITVTSPMVGTFYRSAEPDTPPFVNEGDDVAVGDTLCIVEAMKILHEVKAEQAGKIQHITVNDGDMVEYGQTLFELQPTGV